MGEGTKVAAARSGPHRHAPRTLGTPRRGPAHHLPARTLGSAAAVARPAVCALSRLHGARRARRQPTKNVASYAGVAGADSARGRGRLERRGDGTSGGGALLAGRRYVVSACRGARGLERPGDGRTATGPCSPDVDTPCRGGRGRRVPLQTRPKVTARRETARVLVGAVDAARLRSEGLGPSTLAACSPDVDTSWRCDGGLLESRQGGRRGVSKRSPLRASTPPPPSHLAFHLRSRLRPQVSPPRTMENRRGRTYHVVECRTRSTRCVARRRQ